jgi:hypothetical protein
MDGVSGEIVFEFTVTSADSSSLHERWQVLLGVVGNLSVEVCGRTLYREVEFPLVELAVDLSRWLQEVDQTNESFVFRSMESEEAGLIWIKRDDGLWGVGSVHQDHKDEHTFSLGEVASAVRVYIDGLTGTLLRGHGIDIRDLLAQHGGE